MPDKHALLRRLYMPYKKCVCVRESYAYSFIKVCYKMFYTVTVTDFFFCKYNAVVMILSFIVVASHSQFSRA